MVDESYAFLEHEGDAGAPLLFVFHGTGGDETQFFGLAREILPKAHVIAPRGDVLEFGAARFFRRNAEGVYDMDDLAKRTKKMAAFVDAHRRETGAARVIGLGYSNGANILASTTFAHPRMFDDVVLMHPLIPWRPADRKGETWPRILITAGRRDPICPPALTQALQDHLRTQGADVRTEWHDGGHDIRRNELDAVSAFLAEISSETGL